jgi:Ran GTPase-activating protein (RanGAP) involved in mRNA processing and transport
MDLCQATQNLSLAHQNLTLTLSKPIFKALNHQTNLMFLDLANNCLQNDGIKFLAHALPTLTQLKSLNLSSNMITATGVECLAAIFEHDNFTLGSNVVSTVLPNLNELELSYNPLGNDSVKCLAKVCNSLPQLRKLGIMCCKLESFYDFDLNFGNLLELNVSYNQLMPEAVRKLLTKLNSCIISRLNLDFCSPKMENFGKDVATFFDSGTGSCLASLHLSNLSLNDSDLWEIVCSIKKCDNLKELHLLQNPLTTVSLKYLLNKLPNLKVLHLDGCNRLLRSLDTTFFQESNESSEKYPELVTLSVSCAADRFEQINALEMLWKQCWGEKAKIDVHQNRVKLYTKRNM